MKSGPVTAWPWPKRPTTSSGPQSVSAAPGAAGSPGCQRPEWWPVRSSTGPAAPSIRTSTPIWSWPTSPRVWTARWSAVDGRGIFDHLRAVRGIYHARLRMELGGRLGVAWDVPRSGMGDVRGVDPRMRHLFSQRSAAIAEYAARQFDRAPWSAPDPRRLLRHPTGQGPHPDRRIAGRGVEGPGRRVRVRAGRSHPGGRARAHGPTGRGGRRRPGARPTRGTVRWTVVRWPTATWWRWSPAHRRAAHRPSSSSRWPPGWWKRPVRRCPVGEDAGGSAPRPGIRGAPPRSVRTAMGDRRRGPGDRTAPRGC